MMSQTGDPGPHLSDVESRLGGGWGGLQEKTLPVGNGDHPCVCGGSMLCDCGNLAGPAALPTSAMSQSTLQWGNGAVGVVELRA